ncbi:uncharacterized protein LOC128955535 [Oppia nitens]|uniref:uncharacterized protein LOC128955535 n=1 Tax=Oppia nitens TaxID=1686743 RepID=UPI0023DB3552|nr:uncharacterized protein LOC128955535 [Oppia nitens]
MKYPIIIIILYICLIRGKVRRPQNRQNNNDYTDGGAVCKLLAPNGKFDGVQLYHRWTRPSNHNNNDNVTKMMSTYMMYKSGYEWMFMFVDADDKPVIYIDSDSVREIDKNMINKYSLPAVTQNSEHICNVYYQSISKLNVQIECCCDYNSLSGDPNRPMITLESADEFPGDAIVFNPIGGSGDGDGNKNHVIVVDRKSRNISFYYSNSNNIKTTKLMTYDMCKAYGCRKPSFITDIGDDLWKHINGIVDYDLGANKTGHIVTFNIESKPMYCSIPAASGRKRRNIPCRLETLQQYATNCPVIWPSALGTTVLPVDNNQSQPYGSFNNDDDNQNDNENSSTTIIYVLIGAIILVILLVILVASFIAIRSKSGGGGGRGGKQVDEIKPEKREGVPSNIKRKVGKFNTDWYLKLDTISEETMTDINKPSPRSPPKIFNELKHKKL